MRVVYPQPRAMPFLIEPLSAPADIHRCGVSRSHSSSGSRLRRSSTGPAATATRPRRVAIPPRASDETTEPADPNATPITTPATLADTAYATALLADPRPC